jgi:hypothetical protein
LLRSARNQQVCARSCINHPTNPIFILPSLHPSERKFANNPWPFMSSTGQATSSTFSTSNIQLITDALADYTKITGVDLSKNPFAAAIEQWSSPEGILELLQEREKSFKEYRDNNWRLIDCLTPAVRVIQTFSGILGEAVTLVSHKCNLVTLLNRLCQVPFPPAKALFVGIDVLLAVRPSNTLFNNFLCDVLA